MISNYIGEEIFVSGWVYNINGMAGRYQKVNVFKDLRKELFIKAIINELRINNYRIYGDTIINKGLTPIFNNKYIMADINYREWGSIMSKAYNYNDDTLFAYEDPNNLSTTNYKNYSHESLPRNIKMIDTVNYTTYG